MRMEKENRQLILIRHGEAAHMVGAEALTGGWSDTELTPLGLEQARLTGFALARETWPDACGFWTSDLMRTRQTAERIGEALGREAVPVQALREFNNGVAAGMSREAAKSIQAPMDGPIGDWRPYEAGETWNEFMQRVNTFYDSELSEGCHIVVCHRGTAFNLVFRFLGLEPGHVGRIFTDLDPCGIVRLRVSAYGERTIHCLNEKSHLGEARNRYPLD